MNKGMPKTVRFFGKDRKITREGIYYLLNYGRNIEVRIHAQDERYIAIAKVKFLTDNTRLTCAAVGRSIQTAVKGLQVRLSRGMHSIGNLERRLHGKG